MRPALNHHMPFSSPQTGLLARTQHSETNCPSHAGYEALLLPSPSRKTERGIGGICELFEGAAVAQPRMARSSPTETSGFCYVFLFLALSALELIKWMICISCPALLLLPCSAKMITKRLSQIFLSHKISQLCERKDAVLLRG